MKHAKYLLFAIIIVTLLLSCSKKTTEPIPTVATPTFSPAGGTYESVQTVTISSTTLGVTIVFTTDGSDPISSSMAYTNPIEISTTTTIKAKAFREGLTDSQTASATYTINLPEGFVYVPGGTFDANSSYTVTLSSIYFGKYEVTQAEYQAVMGTNPSYFSGNTNRPVERVSWYKAIEYCNRRSMQEGFTPCYVFSIYGTNPDNWPAGWNNPNNHNYVICNWNANGYRLPTEMEWMFAARGGNLSQGYTYSGSNDINAVAWYRANAYDVGSGHHDFGTHDVGTKASNELGTFDMSGNIWEWVWDIYGSYPSGSQTNPTGPASGCFRVLRGGSWANFNDSCTPSLRHYLSPEIASEFIGFRVLRVSP